MSNKEQLSRLLDALHRQFPDWSSTFGPCSTEDCNESARGSGLCKHCITKKIGETVGYPAARKYLFYTEQLASMRRSMYDVTKKSGESE